LAGRIDLHPTGPHPDSLAAQVLDFMHKTSLGLPALAVAADVVAAECRFSCWVSAEVKGSGLGDAWWMRFLETGEANNERCGAAMAAFAAGGSQENLL
jgi:hypothetical protein